MSQETEESAQARRSAWGIALGAGSEFVAYALIGVVAGTWIDKKFGFATPWAALGGSVGAITLGLYRFVRAFVRPQNGPQGRR
ncbi:MAG: AtpZ/AtpI family protein [Elusimicrobiota bacterium]